MRHWRGETAERGSHRIVASTEVVQPCSAERKLATVDNQPSSLNSPRSSLPNYCAIRYTSQIIQHAVQQNCASGWSPRCCAQNNGWRNLLLYTFSPLKWIMRFVDMLLAVLLFFSPLLENCRPPFHWILLTESTLSHYVLSLSPSIGFSFFILVVVYYRTFPCPKNSGQGRIREEGEQKRADLFPINIRPEGYGHTHESALSSSFFSLSRLLLSRSWARLLFADFSFLFSFDFSLSLLFFFYFIFANNRIDSIRSRDLPSSTES